MTILIQWLGQGWYKGSGFLSRRKSTNKELIKCKKGGTLYLYLFEKYKNEFQSKASFTYGAFDKGELVGIITLYQEKLNKLRHRAHIGAMYVSPSKRGLGIGKALMEEAIKKAKSIEDLEQVYLAVVSTNESAKKLYSSLGFEVFGTEKKGLKLENNIYFDVDFMILYL